MSEPMPNDTFSERWKCSVEQLRQEHSLDGFLKMHENGEVSSLELFHLTYQHWYDHLESRDHFLSGLANHQSAAIQKVAKELSAFIAKYH